MKHDFEEESITNLEDKSDALIEKDPKLSKDLSVDEQYNLIKRVILDGIDKALLGNEAEIMSSHDKCIPNSYS